MFNDARASSITERLDHAPCGWLSFGDDGVVTEINATLADRLGVAREEVVGASVERLLPPATRMFCQTHLFPMLRMSGEAREIFLLLRGKNGEEIGVLCNARRHRQGDTAVTDFVLMEVRERRKFEDALIEARRTVELANEQLEEQAAELEMQQQQLQEQATELETQTDALQELNDELVERTAELERASAAADAANHAKSDFLASMSHELRTPLNAIGGYAQLIENEIYGPVSSEQREALARIGRSQRHLLGLINDILNLARVESGRVEYAQADIAAPDVVSELTAMIEPQMQAKNLRYVIDLPEYRLVVRADREKLVQILLNLLSNAVKFTEAGGTITLRWRHSEGDQPFARIDVMDTGRGIPADKLDAVFDSFVQVRANPSVANEGTGLGLAISRNLARGMGGDLVAESELGRGSMFSLTVPLSTQHATTEHATTKEMV